jgi:hypothetical protein
MDGSLTIHEVFGSERVHLLQDRSKFGGLMHDWYRRPVMFTIEQINDFHARLGSARTLPEYVLALKGLGVERYDSYLADGHSEYFGQGDHKVVSPPVHDVLPVAETSQRETFLQHLRQHGRREDDLLRDVQGLGAERDRKVDC